MTTQLPLTAHTLPSLQVLANAKFGLTPQQTLDVLNRLYEQRLITYPRTDNGYLPLSLYKQARKQVKRCRGLIPHSDAYERHLLVDHRYQGPVWDDAKCTTHHGIIPTDAPALWLYGLNTVEMQVYALVCEQFLKLFSRQD